MRDTRPRAERRGCGGRLIAAFIQEPLCQMQQLSKEQVPSLAVPAECSNSSAPKSKSCAGKCSNLTARNDGEEEKKIEDLERI